MTFSATLFIIFLSIFVIVLVLLWALARKFSPTVQRLRLLGGGQSKAATQNIHATRSTARKNIREKAEKILENVSNNLVKSQKRKANPKLHRKLVMAGDRRENNVSVFLTVKALTCGSLFLVTWLMFFLGVFATPENANPFMLALMAGFAGYILPDIMLNSKVNKRQSAVGDGLSDALDMLVICVEAGLGLNAAILRVGKDIIYRSAPLSEELMLVSQEMRTGLTREEALRNLSDRNRIEDLKILVSSLILSDRLGTSLATTLRAQSDSLRVRVRQRAEEKAAKIGVKMLIPLVLFILPALFVVLMGPAVITVIKTLTSM
jgi:tight adherence protein C